MYIFALASPNYFSPTSKTLTPKTEIITFMSSLNSTQTYAGFNVAICKTVGHTAKV